jgi:ribosomal protein L11 methyltransferase
LVGEVSVSQLKVGVRKVGSRWLQAALEAEPHAVSWAESGTAAIVYGSESALTALQAQLAATAPARAGLRMQLSPVDETWRTAWVEHLQPVQLTPSVTLVPATAGVGDCSTGQTDGAAFGRSLVLLPALAFGFGEHPSTRLAACWVESAVRARRGRLLDVGCGTGVLSLVAALSGAEVAVGIDIEAEAVAVAQRNAELNALSEYCHFKVCAAEELPTHVHDGFNTVVCNLEAHWLCQAAAAVAHFIGPKTQLGITGLLAEQEAQVTEAYAAHGLALTVAGSEDDWVLLVGGRG